MEEVPLEVAAAPIGLHGGQRQPAVLGLANRAAHLGRRLDAAEVGIVRTGVVTGIALLIGVPHGAARGAEYTPW